jgi:hypothetical protein
MGNAAVCKEKYYVVIRLKFLPKLPDITPNDTFSAQQPDTPLD